MSDEPGFFAELLAFVRHYWLWWLIPIVLFVLIVAVAAVFSGGNEGGFVYDIF